MKPGEAGDDERRATRGRWISGSCAARRGKQYDLRLGTSAEQATVGHWLLVISIPMMGLGMAIYLAATSFEPPVPAGEAAQLIKGMAAILTVVGLLSAFIVCAVIVVQTARHLRTR